MVSAAAAAGQAAGGLLLGNLMHIKQLLLPSLHAGCYFWELACAGIRTSESAAVSGRERLHAGDSLSMANSAGGYIPHTVTVPGDSSSSGIAYDGNTSDGTYGDPLLMVAPDAASSEAPTTACPYPASAATTNTRRSTKYDADGRGSGISSEVPVFFSESFLGES
jgi:hypothetical protein